MSCAIPNSIKIYLLDFSTLQRTFLPEKLPLTQRSENVRFHQRGISLVAALMLIVFVSIAVFGVTIFIVQRLSQNEANRTHTRCGFLAQAGPHRALYDFREHDRTGTGYFTLGATNIDANNRFTLAASEAQLLMVNTATARLSPAGGTDLINLRIQNATNSRSIRIDRMIVTWNNARRLTQIRINNINVWNGNLASPANANINNFSLNTPTIYTIRYVRFNGNMLTVPTIPPGSPLTITIQFVMRDGSTKTLTAYPASNNNIFTVQSTGTTTGSTIYRKIQADYNANAIPGRIVTYSEIP